MIMKITMLHFKTVIKYSLLISHTYGNCNMSHNDRNHNHIRLTMDSKFLHNIFHYNPEFRIDNDCPQSSRGTQYQQYNTDTCLYTGIDFLLRRLLYIGPRVPMLAKVPMHSEYHIHHHNSNKKFMRLVRPYIID